MSNALPSVLANAIFSGDMRVLRERVSADPSLKSLSFTYSYTQELGSDGCWDRTVTETATIDKFLKAGIKNSGNRCYNYYLVKVG